MRIQLDIPETVAEAIRLPQDAIEEALLLELAIALYAQGLLGLGKARELAGLDKHTFAQHLAEHRVARHYDEADLADDVTYARSE